VKKPVPFGKYYLLERINVGGMAEVFRAKAYGVEGFERLVAVKRILPNIAEDKDFITMFIDEAKIAVQLNHANIAQIFDLGVVDSSYYIALEHVHGRDLRAIFDRCRTNAEPMPIAQACFVLMKVCEGLDYAHNKRNQSGEELGLVHRDVSPQNVLVSFEGEVKLIDFGIAKAAGKGTKTQAGILKGKFGYMSPEQVRGLPINRRSDIFSCGIVLYELLTGERLFVGESDFSTLEKVRNVEILPPSTYNRRIPDELERIVLKALAKDPDDRYQNAIDLHDELQAFVYTAGEFYSRKDLAGWMKNTFSREIEAETAKLEQFRQLPRPPELSSGPRNRPPTSAPPPPPNGRAAGMAAAGEGLEWDDDELETHIYEGEGPKPLPNPPAAGAGAGVAVASAGAGAGGEPDLSSLVQSSAEWPAGPDRSTSGQHEAVSPPPNVANGSNKTHTPFDDGLADDPPDYEAEDPSAIVRLAEGKPQPSYEGDPVAAAAFGGGMLASQRAQTEGPSPKVIAVGIVAALAAIVLLGVIVTGGDDSEPAAGAGTSEGQAAALPGEAGAAETAPADQPGAPAVASGEAYLETGFDIIVDPKGAAIELDGGDVGPAPRKIRNVVPGAHRLSITAPGFEPLEQEIIAEQGKAPVLRLEMVPLTITGKFTSEPPGARVTLIENGDKRRLGSAPVDARLDPRATYEVRFEKSGYVTVTRPVTVGKAPEVVVAAVMERSPVQATRRPVAKTPTPTPAPPREVTPAPTPAPRKPAPKAPAGPPGNLLIGSKPPCKIFIDGKDTGLKTPQRGIKLAPGTHKITLVNNEQNLKKTIRVKIESGKDTRVIENLLAN